MQTATLPLATLAVAVVSTVAHADDRITMGYLASQPIAESGSGVAQAIAVRFDRAITRRIELGAGLQLGFSGGDEPLQRFALLPGIALVHAIGRVTLRLEEQIGWQVVRGRLTLDGIPLRGTETRSFHQELAAAIETGVNDVVTLRARAGLVIDGIYPAGHASTRAGPFVGFAVVVTP